MSQAVVIKDKRFRPYISEQRIAAAVKGLADAINKDLNLEFPLFVVVLNGSFMFASDLIKEIRIPCEVSFIKLASYQGMKSSGKVTDLIGLSEDVKDRTVVIVEDIVDSGKTLERIAAVMQEKGAKAIKVATAVFKPDSYKNSLQIDYVGFRIPNDFVVGYGMDYDGLGRNLKEIHVLA
jgi:hypoxanthine phosphoribosyltransferase